MLVLTSNKVANGGGPRPMLAMEGCRFDTLRADLCEYNDNRYHVRLWHIKHKLAGRQVGERTHMHERFGVVVIKPVCVCVLILCELEPYGHACAQMYLRTVA